MGEIWKEVPEFEGIYQVSNFGNVKRLPIERTQHNGGVYLSKEYILKTKKKSIFAITLRHEKRYKNVVVNRLVYSVFNEIKLLRNHIIFAVDGNPLNCRLDNLKFITKRNFVATKMKNKNGYTGVSYFATRGDYLAKIDFEGKSFVLHTSKNKEECIKLYQAAKLCFEEYDRIKTSVLSKSAPNRLINKKIVI